MMIDKHSGQTAAVKPVARLPVTWPVPPAARQSPLETVFVGFQHATRDGSHCHCALR